MHQHEVSAADQFVDDLTEKRADDDDDENLTRIGNIFP